MEKKRKGQVDSFRNLPRNKSVRKMADNAITTLVKKDRHLESRVDIAEFRSKGDHSLLPRKERE